MIFNPDLRPKPKNYDGRPGIKRAEQKLDGHRMTFVHENGRVRAFGKHIGINCWDELRKCPKIAMMDLPPDTTVDGEIYIPGKPASDVVTAIKEGSSDLKFCAFAVPVWRGSRLTYESFSEVDIILHQMGFQEGPKLFPIADATKEKALELKIEGFVLKEFHYSGWWKVKPQPTMDVIVIGTKPGKGKHLGRLGALIVAVYKQGDGLIEIASIGKGGDEHWRDLKPSECISRVCEISHEGLQAKGKLRFSNFMRWRDDKPSEECTWDQLY